ncbi:uncharacterized protein LOC128133379 [Lactuca sativa]|uniref:uncharacterized protein LOC128133379 n=1 Tax=Lactuca sativa TaxID=4236 RepID=UPI0022B0421E|nr:uncharacterized protein LOC128133379 [Lactuca sativa]
MIQLDDEILEKELAHLMKEDPSKFVMHSEEEGDKKKIAEKGKERGVQYANIACLDAVKFEEGLSTGKDAGIKERKEEADHQFTTKPRARTIMKYEVIKFKEKEVQETVKKKGVKKKKRKRQAQAAGDEAMKRKRDELKRAYKKKIHAYKTKYKSQKVRRAFPMPEDDKT